jgi:Domain of unknown function (DUF5658)
MVRTTWFASLVLVFISVATVPGFAADDRASATTDPEVVPALNLAPPTRGLVLPGLYVGAAALQVYDGFSTMNGLKHGAVEANPVMAGIAGKSVALWAVKGGVTALSIYASERLWKQHRRAEAIAMMVAVNGVAAAVAARNASVTRVR